MTRSHTGGVPARTLSIVVPVLNEAQRIDGQLRRLTALPGVTDVVVADGGSTDGTAARALAVPGVRVVTAPRGRGPQMNAGARAALGDVIWFVHADVVVPDDGPALIADTLRDPAVVAGAFHVRTGPDGMTGWPSRLLWIADLRSRYSRLPYGDQALFVRREVFEAIGGFAAVPLFEDLDLSRRLRRAGTLRVLPALVHASGRRFMMRPVASALQMILLPLLYRAGVPPATLARLYGHVR
jgi:rSAM/selenodomain-associated transferase 2